ncbi:ATP-binding protein [Burkholderia thailandensis]|uniref:ATP-binding protein n=1 Tax=Burkholderia thailandensis TaxID=57975 RepID=UPI0003EC6A66|nr:ATP-binding protein [Burkholderia thailandensis]AHI63298.1 ftsK/SpoIIIE family protein [Burkholderia thailandensis H0587]AVR24729.1 ATP-binding protein [Burkholderia thailandensis]MCZ2897017.1 ATP-binding protein [Burkholderia thailandensis]
MATFELLKDLKIGYIVEVSGTSLRVELDGDVTELTRTHEGRVYPIGQMGSVVKIHFGRRIVFGFVTLLRMRSEELIELGQAIPPEADQRIMEVELFAEGTWNSVGNTLKFMRGVTTFPLPRQGVYLLTRDESIALYTSAEGQRSAGEADPLVPFAAYVGADSTMCRANIDRMFSMHCAVLGSTGSGKSGAVAAVLRSVLEHKAQGDDVCHPRAIVIDPHAEYGTAFADRAIVYRAYDPIGNEPDIGERVSLPYWLMSAEEFRLLVIGKTEFEATSQHNIIYKALTHARMVNAGLVDPAPTQHGGAASKDGDEPDAPRAKAGIDSALLEAFDRDKPRPFSLDEVINHIIFLQGAKVSKDGERLEPIAPSDFAKTYKSVLDKLAVLRRDPRIRFMMANWTMESPTLADILYQFVGTIPERESKDLRILDISGLPNEVAGPLTAAVARLLFQYKVYQSEEERASDPVLLVCEEAHRYVPDRGEAEYATAQVAVRRIAREGRKYGIGLMLVSQRPADVESTVISQCGTWLVLRLTNQADQQHVSRFLPDGLSGMTRALPNLAQQEAIFVGEGAALPARIRIRDLSENQLPRSRSACFAHGWSAPRLSHDQIGAVAARMSA